MLRYFLTRIGWALVAVLLIVIVNFLIIKAVPGDPVIAMIGEYPAPPDYVERIRAEYGLDQPVWVQLYRYLFNVMQGDLGYSFASRQPVLDLLLTRSGYTLMLILPSLVLSTVLGVWLALKAASRAGGAVDNGITVLTLFGYSIPSFWLAQILVLVFGITLGVLPASGMYSVRNPAQGWAAVWDVLNHMILPIICIMSFKLAIFARTARASAMGVIRADFVTTARAKGLGSRQVLRRHVLPNAAIPVIAILGYQFGHALTSTMLIETVFAWPGIGQLFVTSITNRDFPVLQGVLLFATIFVVTANLLADLVYVYVDPRIRRSIGGRNA